MELPELKDIEAAMLQEYDRVFESDGLDEHPRRTGRPARQRLPRLATFHRWFGRCKGGCRPPYTYFTVRFGAVVFFLRFSFSCHDLGVELGRWKHRAARKDRICTYCDEGCLDDELHMISECPAMQVVREQYSHLSISQNRQIYQTFSRRMIILLS